MIYLAKYNTQTVISFPMIKRAVVDFAVSADWTPATGDTKVSKDQGSVANTTNNPTATAGTGSALWNLTLTATELSAAEVVIQIVDSATKAVEDQCLIIYTYGNASAKIVEDVSLANQLANVIQWNTTNVASPATAGIPEVNIKNMNNVSASAITTVKAVQGLTTADTVSLTAAERNSIADAAFIRQMVESYVADGTAPTLAQALFMILQSIQEFSISGTTITTKKIDKATTAMTFTLDSATTPTSRTRAT